MKKLVSAALALALTLSMSTVAFADNATNQDASFTKAYKITNENTSNPAETFTFKFTADRVTDSNKNLQKENMPAIADATVAYDEGTAITGNGLVKDVSVALQNVEWPGVGVYYYKVNEVAGNTAGVSYDATTAYLKVTVAYNEDTSTYYTAFVTLNLADENGDGQTDSKTAGFTNEYSAGNLAITKNVTGNMGDKNAYFAVKVKLTGETDKTYKTNYPVTGGSESSEASQKNPQTIAMDTETTIWLKSGDTVTIENLPYGVTYTVVEDDYTTVQKGNYDDPAYSFSDTNKKIDSASDTVTITNNKGTTVDTGINLDSMPYVLMLVVAGAGLAVFFFKKRMMHEN